MVYSKKTYIESSREVIVKLTCKAARGSAPFGRLSIGCKKTDVISVKSIDFDFSRSPPDPESSY